MSSSGKRRRLDKEPTALNLRNAYSRPVSTPDSTDAAQRFNDGLVWLFGFHHQEAEKCFFEVVDLQPDFILGYWGIACANAPNYNFHGAAFYEASMGDEWPSQQRAIDALNSALAIVESSPSGGGREGLMVRAARARFGAAPLEKSTGQELAYKLAMQELYTKYPEDAEVVYAYAESTMVLRPWNLWVGGRATEEALEAKPVLEYGLSKWPAHTGLCHLYVHLMEMSSQPELALGACGVLRSLDIDAGHLIHMASHIDVLVGDYYAAVVANRRALVADDRCVALGAGGGAGTIYAEYIAHDAHMLVYSAMLGGMEAAARAAAAKMHEYVSERTLMERPHSQESQEAYWPMHVHVLLRFGHWEEVLALPFPADVYAMPYSTAVLRYARAVSFAVMGRVEDAKEEEKRFLKAKRHSGIKWRYLHNNVAIDLLNVHAKVLKGEILYREGSFARSFKQLRAAVTLEDALPYDEPPGIMQPSRHALGALLLEQGNVDEANEVYLADLAPGKHPENPWSLVGMMKCQKAANEDFNAVEARLLEQQRKCGISSDAIKVSCACASASTSDTAA